MNNLSINNSTFSSPEVRRSERLKPLTEASPNTRIQEVVQNNTTPLKKYPLITDDKGWVSLPLTPGAKTAARVIYMFRQKSTGKVLIGKTETKVQKRISSYVTSFNKENDAGKLPLPVAVRKNPTDFEFGILCHAPTDLDLAALEKSYIDLKSAVTNGFNRRGGGGGSRLVKKTIETSEKVDSIKKNLFKDFQTPAKKKVIRAGQNYKVLLTPQTKEAKKVVYVFKNEKTNERYVGSTVRQLTRRLNEHMHYAKNTTKDRSKAPLYEALRKEPEQISVGILYSASSDDPTVLDGIEKAFIEHYDSVKTGYNRKK